MEHNDLEHSTTEFLADQSGVLKYFYLPLSPLTSSFYKIGVHNEEDNASALKRKAPLA